MTTVNTEWSRLHDATLVTVTAEWGSAVTRVRVRLSEAPSREAEILVSGAMLLRCPREQPWGPSVSINEVRCMSTPEGRKRLEVEVQSGDVIEIEGEGIELQVRD